MAFVDQQSVYPSNKDLAETPGFGEVGLENNVSKSYYHQYQRNSVSGASAWKLTDPNNGLDVLLTGDGENGGFAMVRGHRCVMTSTLTLKNSGNDNDVIGQMQANSYNHIFLTINRDGQLEVDKLQIVINTSGVYPQTNGNAVKLGIAITDGTDVTEILDRRPSSICQPLFCEIPPREHATAASFVYGVKTYINAPILGQQTVLSIAFLAGAAGTPLNGDQDFTWKCEVTGPGPDGLGLSQESAEFNFTTKKNVISGTPQVETVHRGFIIIENEIGRFDGGLLEIRMAVKPASNNNVLITTFDSDVAKEWDVRGGHRVQNWIAEG